MCLSFQDPISINNRMLFEPQLKPNCVHVYFFPKSNKGVQKTVKSISTFCNGSNEENGIITKFIEILQRSVSVTGLR